WSRSSFHPSSPLSGMPSGLACQFPAVALAMSLSRQILREVLGAGGRTYGQEKSTWVARSQRGHALSPVSGSLSGKGSWVCRRTTCFSPLHGTLTRGGSDRTRHSRRPGPERGMRGDAVRATEQVRIGRQARLLAG